jgi:hypothetical protein
MLNFSKIKIIEFFCMNEIQNRLRISKFFINFQLIDNFRINEILSLLHEKKLVFRRIKKKNLT